MKIKTRKKFERSSNVFGNLKASYLQYSMELNRRGVINNFGKDNEPTKAVWLEPRRAG